MAPAKLTAEDEERRGHVVMAVRHDRAPLLQGEDLFAEYQAAAGPLDLAEREPQARRATILEFQVAGQPLEIDQLQQVGDVDLREQLLDLLLPHELLDLLVLQILAQLVHVGQPAAGQRLDFVGPQVVLE